MIKKDHHQRQFQLQEQKPRRQSLFRRSAVDDDHNTGTDRYLITYSDLITLLLGLFVILYASSQVDSSKFKEFSAAFSEYFRAKDSKILQGGDGVLEGNKKGVPQPILNPASAKSMQEIEKETHQILKDFIEKGTIKFKADKNSIILTLPEKLVFQSARADVQKQALPILDSVAKVLNNVNFQITVDGHTDADPIRTFQFESNWDLSITRARNVAYELITRGMPETNLIIRGFGMWRPVTDNTTPEGKSQNRRVEITISNTSSENPANLENVPQSVNRKDKP